MDRLEKIKEQYDWGENYLEHGSSNLDEEDINWMIETIEQQQEDLKKADHHNAMLHMRIKEKDAEIEGYKSLLQGEIDSRKATDELLQESRKEIKRLRNTVMSKGYLKVLEENERLKDVLHEIVSEYQEGNANPSLMYHLAKDTIR